MLLRTFNLDNLNLLDVLNGICSLMFYKNLTQTIKMTLTHFLKSADKIFDLIEKDDFDVSLFQTKTGFKSLNHITVKIFSSTIFYCVFFCGNNCVH